MNDNIVYKSTSEFLKYISNKAKSKSNSQNQMTKVNKNNNKAKKPNHINIQTGKLNFQ